MYQVDLRKIDLNLFVVLSTLLVERSTTKAAERLQMSQAAVSAALQRLRVTFHDPLFVRDGRGMKPTSRALELGRLVEAGLQSMAQAVSDREMFDPSVSDRDFRLAMSDDLEIFLFPELLQERALHTSNVSLFVRQASSASIGRMLDNGDIDLGISAGGPLGPEYRTKLLFASEYACLFDRGQTDIEGDITLEQFVELPHIMVSQGNRGIVDDLLADQGLQRRRVGATSHFAMTPFLLKGSPRLATLPKHAAERLAVAFDLDVTPPPLTMPTFDISMVWRATSDADPGAIWLRGEVESVVGRILL